MNEKLELKLSDRFSFAESRPGYTGKTSGFPIDFECGDGWYDIIYSLFEKIEQDLRKYPNEDFHITQVKEKYGVLSVYTSSIVVDSSIFDYICSAEKESRFTCEMCGTSNKVELRGYVWFQTLCESCFIERKKWYSGK